MIQINSTLKGEEKNCLPSAWLFLTNEMDCYVAISKAPCPSRIEKEILNEY
jgi:hypothetical protein